MSCQHCNGTGHAPKANLEERVAGLRARCTELEFIVSWDGFVTTNAAAALLNRAPGTINNWLHQDRPLHHRKLHGRIEYSLAGIAQMLIDAENTPD